MCIRDSVEEARHQIAVVRELGQQHLDGRAPAQHRVLGDVDGAHAALPDQREHVVVRDRLADETAGRFGLPAVAARAHGYGVEPPSTRPRSDSIAAIVCCGSWRRTSGANSLAIRLFGLMSIL